MKDFSQDKQSRLLALLTEELAIFKQIRELTGKQAELLGTEDVTALDESLTSRQELIEKINGLHQETEVLMQSYISFKGAAGKSKIAGIETASDELRGVIIECAGLNDKNMALAKGKNEEYSERIGKLNVGRKSLGAYAQSIPNNSELFDTKT